MSPLSHSPAVCVQLSAGNSNNLFSIDKQTGLMTRGRRALDRETSSSHVLEVEAYNSDEGSMRSSVRVRKTSEGSRCFVSDVSFKKKERSRRTHTRIVEEESTHSRVADL